MPIVARGLVPLLVIAFVAYCVFDVIATDAGRVRNLPKIPWLFIVLLFPPIGGIAWLLLGRPEGAGFAVGGEAPRRTHGPPERPSFTVPEEEKPLKESREEAIRRYEEERRRRREEQERLGRELLEHNDPAFPDDADALSDSLEGEISRLERELLGADETNEPDEPDDDEPAGG